MTISESNKWTRVLNQEVSTCLDSKTSFQMSDLEKEKNSKAAESDIVYFEAQSPEPWIFRTPFYDKDLPFPDDDMDVLSDTIRIDSGKVPSPLMRLKSTSSLSSNSESQNLSGRFSPAPSLDSSSKSDKVNKLGATQSTGLNFRSSEDLSMVKGLFSSASLNESTLTNTSNQSTNLDSHDKIVESRTLTEKSSDEIRDPRTKKEYSTDAAINDRIYESREVEVGVIGSAVAMHGQKGDVQQQDQDPESLFSQNAQGTNSMSSDTDVPNIESASVNYKASSEKCSIEDSVKESAQDLHGKSSSSLMKDMKGEISQNEKSDPYYTQTDIESSQQVKDPRTLSDFIYSSAPLSASIAGAAASSSSQKDGLLYDAHGVGPMGNYSGAGKSVKDVDKTMDLFKSSTEDDARSKNGIDINGNTDNGIRNIGSHDGITDQQLVDTNTGSIQQSGLQGSANVQDGKNIRDENYGTSDEPLFDNDKNVQVDAVHAQPQLDYQNVSSINQSARQDNLQSQGGKNIQAINHGSDEEPSLAKDSKVQLEGSGNITNQGQEIKNYGMADTDISNPKVQSGLNAGKFDQELVNDSASHVQNGLMSSIPNDTTATAIALGLAASNIREKSEKSHENEEIPTDISHKISGNVTSKALDAVNNQELNQLKGSGQYSEQIPEMSTTDKSAKGPFEAKSPSSSAGKAADALASRFDGHEMKLEDQMGNPIANMTSAIHSNDILHAGSINSVNDDSNIDHVNQENDKDLEFEYEERLRLLMARTRNADDLLKQLAELIREMNEDIAHLTCENNNQRKELHSLKKLLKK